MFGRSPFTVSPEHLTSLDTGRAVDFFRRLLWAEGLALGIPRDQIDVPSNINAPDGGMTLLYDLRDSAGRHRIVRRAWMAIRSRTGPFNPMDKGNVNALLFTPRSIRARKHELHPRVRSCLDQGGRFVIVLFGWDNPDLSSPALPQPSEQRFEDFNAEYADAKVDVWRTNQLMGCFDIHLSLVRDLTGLADEPFDTYESWSNLDTMRREAYVPVMHSGRRLRRFGASYGRRIRSHTYTSFGRAWDR